MFARVSGRQPQVLHDGAGFASAFGSRGLALQDPNHRPLA